MPRRVPERSTPGDVDPLDLQLDRLGAAPVRSRRRIPWHTLAISWSTSSLPAVLLLLVGTALGPHGLALLTPRALSIIDPAIPVALAALGVLVGLDFHTRRGGEDRLFAAASIQAALTGIIVASGTLFIMPAVTSFDALQTWMIALAAGICASTSSALPARSAASRGSAARMTDREVLLPIIIGGLILAVVRESSIEAAFLLAVQASAVAIVIAAAGWLLLSGTSSETEQRVFGVAALLLVGGVADYLSLSALLTGLIAGACWHAAGGAARESIRRDIGYVHHPLLVLLLLTAGARVDLSPGVLGLAVAYMVLRTAGKLAGGWLALRVASSSLPRIFESELIAPGIFGVAFAMNAERAMSADVSALVTIVVVGTVGSQIISALGGAREDAR